MLYFRQDRSTNASRIARLPAWRRQLVHTDAGTVDVLDIGKEQPRAIILITHGLGSMESLEEIAEGLESRHPGRRVIAYSRPGRGASPLPPVKDRMEGLYHESLRLLPALMEALGLRSADLVAHSDGAAVAMLFASTHPDQVERIVAISPQVHGDRQFAAVTAERLADHRCGDDMERLGADHADPSLAIRCWTADREALARDPDGMLRHIGALKAPLLLVQGLRDDYGVPQQMSVLSDRVNGPMKWVILRQDGHFPQHDSTEVVLDLICGHLDDHDRPAGSAA